MTVILTMAGKLEIDRNIDIRTRSVEKVLLPLISQVGILVNYGMNGISSTNTPETIQKVLPNLELSVCKFTSIGHEMGNFNSVIRDDMVESCDSTNKACNIIVSILNSADENGNNIDGKSLPDAARMLLSSIAKILVLADRTAVIKMIKSAEKVDKRLRELKNVTNFTEFVNAFSQFGGDMVDLAYISGERQNDLKNDIQRAEVCAARALLEKSTMMLLTTCKTCLRHPDSALAVGNRDAVFESMRGAMSILKQVVQDNEFPGLQFCEGVCKLFSRLTKLIEDSINTNSQVSAEMLTCLDDFNKSMDEIINVDNMSSSKKAAIKELILQTKDLQKDISSLCQKDEVKDAEPSISKALKAVHDVCQEMMNELSKASAEQVNIALMNQEYKEVLQSLKEASLSGDIKNVEDIALSLEDVLQNILEVAKLTKNVSSIDPCIITSSRLEENIIRLLPQVVDAGKMLSAHPSSKITQENLEVFIDVWETQIDELLALLGNITQGDPENALED